MIIVNNWCGVQAVCEEIRRLAPKVGLHHDGVVFGSDDFCASIGSYYTLGCVAHKPAVLCLCVSFSDLWQINIRLC